VRCFEFQTPSNVIVYGHLSIPQCLRAIGYKPICAGIQRFTVDAVYKSILSGNQPELKALKAGKCQLSGAHKGYFRLSLDTLGTSFPKRHKSKIERRKVGRQVGSTRSKIIIICRIKTKSDIQNLVSLFSTDKWSSGVFCAFCPLRLSLTQDCPSSRPRRRPGDGHRLLLPLRNSVAIDAELKVL